MVGGRSSAVRSVDIGLISFQITLKRYKRRSASIKRLNRSAAVNLRFLFCQNCGRQLSDNALFCPNCGEPTSKAVNPAISQPLPPSPQGYGAPPPPRGYGAPPPQYYPPPQQYPPQQVAGLARGRASAAWYLLPFFLLLLGGIIGYFVVRDRDRGRANGILIFGIIWTVVVSVFYYVAVYIALGLLFGP